MYWKKFVISFMFFLIIFSRKVSAEEYQVYSGQVPVEYMEIMNNIVIPFDKDSVLFCSAADEYKLIIGDLELHENIYTCIGECSVYTVNSNFEIVKEVINELQLNCGEKIVYSNLGDYPSIYERSDIYEGTTIFIICIGIGFILIMLIFKRVRR